MPFLLTPLREGRHGAAPVDARAGFISTHAPAGGATRRRRRLHTDAADFYSRPCGRGDRGGRTSRDTRPGFLLTPLREGRRTIDGGLCEECRFLLTPLREGRPASGTISVHVSLFLLTPLREGRRVRNGERGCAPLDFYSRPCGRGDKIVIVYGWGKSTISTHAPAGGATRLIASSNPIWFLFLLTPLREGRPEGLGQGFSREIFLLTPLREGRLKGGVVMSPINFISTHAPAGGATAIFHKSVMRFCGKLPKDDTVLCLASFGFPGRDPKAVYLAWISCANLPQKCVREGLALKDQGTSCFHEGLASHAFDPVLV